MAHQLFGKDDLRNRTKEYEGVRRVAKSCEESSDRRVFIAAERLGVQMRDSTIDGKCAPEAEALRLIKKALLKAGSKQNALVAQLLLTAAGLQRSCGMKRAARSKARMQLEGMTIGSVDLVISIHDSN